MASDSGSVSRQATDFAEQLRERLQLEALEDVRRGLGPGSRQLPISTLRLRGGKVIDRHKVAKHFVTTITDESFTFRRNADKIAAEQQLDGL